MKTVAINGRQTLLVCFLVSSVYHWIYLSSTNSIKQQKTLPWCCLTAYIAPTAFSSSILHAAYSPLVLFERVAICTFNLSKQVRDDVIIHRKHRHGSWKSGVKIFFFEKTHGIYYTSDLWFHSLFKFAENYAPTCAQLSRIKTSVAIQERIGQTIQR